MELTGARGRTFIVVVLGVLVAVFYLTAAGHFSYTTDDSYIYFGYARNLATGNGPSFNAGEPSYGFTGPLWMLILSAGGAAGVDIPMFAKVLDLVFAALSIVLFFFVAFEMIRDTAVSFCATLAYSVNAWLLRWAGCGLETSLAVFLLLAFFRYLLRNEYAVASGALGLLSLVRPEAALLVPVLLFDLRVNSVTRAHALREGTRAVSVWLAIVLPWAAYAYGVFGTLVPTTFGAKHGSALRPSDMLDTAVDVVKTLGSADAAMLGILILCLVVVRFVKPKADVDEAEEEEGAIPFHVRRQSLAALAWLLILPLAYILAGVNIVSRYLLLVTPPATAVAFFRLNELLRGRSGAVRYGLVLAATALIMGQNQYITARYVNPHLAAFSEGMESCLVPIADWLRENTPTGTVVMTGDVGALGYYSRRTICDFNGIVSPAVASASRNNDAFTELLRERQWGEYCAPAYIVHRAPTAEALAGVEGLAPLISRPFPGLSISDASTVYYTLYRVEYASPGKLLTGN